MKGWTRTSVNYKTKVEALVPLGQATSIGQRMNIIVWCHSIVVPKLRISD